jgi:hypothetical protein
MWLKLSELVEPCYMITLIQLLSPSSALWLLYEPSAKLPLMTTCSGLLYNRSRQPFYSYRPLLLIFHDWNFLTAHQHFCISIHYMGEHFFSRNLGYLKIAYRPPRKPLPPTSGRYGPDWRPMLYNNTCWTSARNDVTEIIKLSEKLTYLKVQTTF